MQAWIVRKCMEDSLSWRFWDTICVFGLVKEAQIPPFILASMTEVVRLWELSLCSISIGFTILSSPHILPHVWWLPACCSAMNKWRSSVFLSKKKSSGSSRSGSCSFLVTCTSGTWPLPKMAILQMVESPMAVELEFPNKSLANSWSKHWYPFFGAMDSLINESSVQPGTLGPWWPCGAGVFCQPDRTVPGDFSDCSIGAIRSSEDSGSSNAWEALHKPPERNVVTIV